MDTLDVATVRSETIVVPSLRKASLKRKIRANLRDLGFERSPDGALEPRGTDKALIRALHARQRSDRLSANAGFLSRRLPTLLEHFASGCEVSPQDIDPRLERVSAGTWQSDLFRLASLSWSIPVSSGFGRRLRYLVWDDHNAKLIGLIAIGDPVFNLAVRDKRIGWNVHDRGSRLVHMMDAYVLGAVPPYNALLCGKMVACLVRSREVYDDFAQSYGATTGIISGQEKMARLLAVTTSSSMGRSSVYNRLKLGTCLYFRPIGYTGGWGHFHVPDSLFLELRDYLRGIGHPYADHYRFGQGPNWRLRATRAALRALGFREDLLRHGICREVFCCDLATNATELLRTGRGTPDVSSLLNVGTVARLAMERWVVPRSRRRPEFRAWRREYLRRLFVNEEAIEHRGSRAV